VSDTVTTDQIRDQFVLSLAFLPERNISYVLSSNNESPSPNQSWALSLLTLCRPLQRAICRAAGLRPGAPIRIERGGSPPRIGDYCQVVLVGADYVLSRDMLDLVRRRGRRR